METAALETDARPAVEPDLHPWRWRWATGLAHALVFGPVAFHLLYRSDSVRGPNLFPTHTEFAETAFDGLWHFGSPSQLWQVAAKGLDVVLPFDIRFGALIAALLFYAWFGIVVAEVLRPRRTGYGLGPAAALVVSLGLAMLESPAGLWGWGSFTGTGVFMPVYLPYAATTLASLAPNTLLVWEVARWTSGDLPKPLRWRIPALLLLASFAKPTLVPLLLVAVPLVVLIRSIRRRSGSGRERDGRPTMTSVLVLLVGPAIVLTLIQLLVTVRYVVNRGGWVFSPLTELRDLHVRFPFFWLIGLFPILALVVVGKRLFDDEAILLCSTGAVIGVVAALLLRREGTTYQGDVLQLSEAAFAMLMIFIPRRLIELRQRGELSTAAGATLLVVLSTYLVAGLMGWAWRTGLAYPGL
ncbi:hypothetical protein [Aquihabitans sp. McL0605]|uniref:hypothetical protein n=1 Tax=Aquihabitans sp. McL0605 TaxID=3415671 RepID=UPI003CFA39C0